MYYLSKCAWYKMGKLKQRNELNEYSSYKNG